MPAYVGPLPEGAIGLSIWPLSPGFHVTADDPASLPSTTLTIPGATLSAGPLFGDQGVTLTYSDEQETPPDSIVLPEYPDMVTLVFNEL